ncbi:MAG: flagellar assembly peptidoglycan hydrolase FlgJ [Porticoccus sp.]
MSVGTSPIYADFQGLAALRAEARNAPSEAIDEVASQFESLFVQMMLKSMRDATIEGGLFDSSQLDLYQQMFDKQVSLDLSQRGGIGLAETLVTQLNGGQSGDKKQQIADLQTPGQQDAPKPIVSFDQVPVGIRRQVLGLFSSSEVRVDAANDTPGEALTGSTLTGTRLAGTTKAPALVGVGVESRVEPVVVKKNDKTSWLPASPEEFIRNVWDDAVSAAKQLGVDPAVLVAQSALETGWGKKVIQSAEGSSFNLFGIKAGGDWRGDLATVNTLEFRDGLAALEKATFRAYDSLTASFSDYADFLKSSPRYQQALKSVADSKEFLVELQNAGYATDPKYAEKILGILDKSNYSSVINELKNSQ